MTYLGMIGPYQWIIILLAFSGIIFTILALIDILKSEFTGYNKIVWTLIVLSLNLFGALLYFAIGRDQKVKN